MALVGLFQQSPLTLAAIFERLRTIYPDGEVVSSEGRRTYGEIAERVLQLCTVLVERFGLQPSDRVATFAHNSARHFELYYAVYAVPLVGGVLHPVNIRLAPDQVRYIVNHAEGLLDGDADLDLTLTMLTGSWYALALAADPPPRRWAQRTAALVWRALGGEAD
jgi:acyl-CoA synthetase (AMP-forming)/AMP-acid ligase II